MGDDKSVKLVDIVAEMVSSDVRCYRVLARGLAVAFTPQRGDMVQDGARFVWSRRGDHPSEVEDKILQKAIMSGMRAVTDRVVVGGPTFRTGLQIKPGWFSSMLYWSWVGTVALMQLQGKRRARAMEWLEDR